MLLLVGMVETGIDLSWQEINRSSAEPLPETHPLVRTERSVWEVRAAARLLVSSLEDLQLHKALVKRAKILINNFSELSQVLVAAAPENQTRSSSREMFSPSRRVTDSRLTLFSIIHPEKTRTITDSVR